MNHDRPNRPLSWRIAVLLLTASILLTGCLTKRGGTDATSAATEQYEEYKASSQQTQKEFDAFTDQIFFDEIKKSTISLHYLMADPASFGITEIPVTFGAISLDEMKAEMADTRRLSEELAKFSVRDLTDDQKLTYRIFKDYLDTALLSEGMELYEQPLAPTIGVQAQLPILLSEYTFYTKQDIDVYLKLLSSIDEYYQKIGELEKAKSEAGLFMSDSAVDDIITSCESYLIIPENSFLTETFKERLDHVDGLTEEEKKTYEAENIRILGEHFVPAYQQMIETLNSLKGTGTNEQGMCGYPDGKAYYEYLVRSVTGTSYKSIDELTQAIAGQIDSDTASIALLLKANPDVVSKIYDYSFRLTEPTEILDDLQKQIVDYYPPLPACNYTVKSVPKALELSLSPAFYLTPPIDRFEDNVIYINGNEQYSDEDLYPTLAHEGYPGHLYQTVYFINQKPTKLRHLLSFGSYTEGWATYVELQSYLFDNGLDPTLQQILKYNRSSLLGLHAYLDLQINYYGWTREQVAEFLNQRYSVVNDETIDSIYHTMIENPANYLEYYVGYLEILNMRKEAEASKGMAFNEKDFHQFLLDLGPAPFTVIRLYFSEWMNRLPDLAPETEKSE